MLELWGMWSTPSLPSLPDPPWPGVVAPNRVLSMGQIELNCVFMLTCIVWNRTVFWHWNWVLMLNWTVWNRTVYKYKNGFGINNLQWLMCYKTEPNLYFQFILPLLSSSHSFFHSIFCGIQKIWKDFSQPMLLHSWSTREMLCSKSIVTETISIKPEMKN